MPKYSTFKKRKVQKDKEHIWELYQTGLTMEEVSERVKYGKTFVYKAIKEMRELSTG